MARTALAQATNFAHLLGLSRPPQAAEDNKPADNDERKQRDGESDDDYQARMKALDEKEQKDAKAGEPNDDEQARAEHGNGDDKGNDETDEADMRNAQTAQVVRRATARCAAIFADAAAARRPDMAAYFAFGTTMGRSSAIQALRAVVNGERPADPPPASQPRGRTGLSDRMSQEPNRAVGPDASKPAAAPGEDGKMDPKAFADAVVAIDRRRRGES